MPSFFYPPGAMRALLETEFVTPATRAALQERLEPVEAPRRFFSEAETATLRAVCARLIPQPERAAPIEIASQIDARLSQGKGNGWRYDALPDDGQALRLGLRGLDESAQILHSTDFIALNEAQQDLILSAVQNEEAQGEVWKTLPPRRFFEELLAEVTECYYAHPLAQEEIGYAGMADVPGWTRIGLNEREEREPQALEPQANESQANES